MTLTPGIYGDALHLEMFGDGSDADLSVSSGTTTLTRCMSYGQLTITGTASIDVGIFSPLRCNGLLDLTNAPASAIVCSGITGNNGAAQTTAGTVTGTITIQAAWVPGRAVNVAGAAGGSTNGSSSAAVSDTVMALGARGAQGGAAGNGTSGNGGTAGAVTVTGTNAYVRSPFPRYFGQGTGVLAAGGKSSGGGGGGGDGTQGGGGGASGTCPPVLSIAAAVINRDSSTTTAACIANVAGNGGSGGSPAAGNRGGGGAGGGGAGGFCQVVAGRFLGTAKSGAISVAGGAGGNGGTASGTGTNGSGGTGAAGGNCHVWDLSTGTLTETLGSAGSAASGATGGAGGACSATL